MVWDSPVTGGTGFRAGWWHQSSFCGRGMWCARPCAAVERNRGADGVASATDASDRLTFFAADLTSDEGWTLPVGCDYVLHFSLAVGSADLSRDPNAWFAPARTCLCGCFVQAAELVRQARGDDSRPPPPPLRRHGSDTVSDETVWAYPAIASFDAYRRSKSVRNARPWDFMAGKHRPTHWQPSSRLLCSVRCCDAGESSAPFKIIPRLVGMAVPPAFHPWIWVVVCATWPI